MKKIIITIILGLVITTGFSVKNVYADPTLGSQQVDDGVPGVPPPYSNNNSSNSAPFKLENPIAVGSLPELVAKILDIVLTIGIPIVAFFIIYSGFKFVLARGNEEKLKEAKQSILYTLLGAALLVGAWVLATAIDSIIDSIKSVA